MAGFVENDDRLENTDVATAFITDAPPTGFCLWVKPDASSSAILPVAVQFSVNESPISGGGSYLVLGVVGGVWAVITESLSLAASVYAAGVWRFIAVQITAGTSSGFKFKIYSRPETLNDGTWENELTYDNQAYDKAAYDYHSIGGAIEVSFLAGFFGEIKHFKLTPAIELSSAEWYNESVRAAPFRSGVAWCPVQMGPEILNFRYGITSADDLGTYTYNNEPQADVVNPRITQTMARHGLRYEISVNRQYNLPAGEVNFQSATSLAARVGVRKDLCGGDLLLDLACLTPIRGNGVALAPGLLTLDGSGLGFAVGRTSLLHTGDAEFIGDRLTGVAGKGQALAPGLVTFFGYPLSARLGNTTTILTGNIEFIGDTLSLVRGQGAALHQGVLQVFGYPLSATSGAAVSLHTGAASFLGGDPFVISFGNSVLIPTGTLTLVLLPLSFERPIAPVIVEGLNLEVNDADLVATVGVAEIEATVADADVATTLDSADLSVTTSGAELEVSLDAASIDVELD